MKKYLLRRCEDIQQDKHDNIRDILKNSEVDKLQKNDSSFQTDTDDNTDSSSKQEIESILLSNSKKVAINRQLLRALISANASLSFIEDTE
ncbi:512_t:CDS:1, partial [Cetraspora pellucida]